MKLTNVFGKSALAATLAIGATLGTAGIALADEVGADQIPTTTVTTTNAYVRGAATRAAMPSIEILGLNSVEESGQFITITDERPEYLWDQPKYFIDASYYNSNLSPLLANLATGFGTTQYPAAVILTSRSGGGNGPNASLGADDTSVWNLEPKLVVGTGGSNWSSVYRQHGATGVAYSFSDYNGLIDTMYDIAENADDVADSTGRDLRYGDAFTIAENYEAYINGTVNYIKANAASTNRVVALVSGYDSSTGLYTIAPTSGSDGTASQNRYLETTVSKGLANNLNSGTTEITVDAVTLAGVDLIMIGGQSSSSNFSTIYEGLDREVTIEATEEGEEDKVVDLLDKTYYVENNGSQGSTYGVTMNSVENAQNIGRILGMLYSDVINQQSWMAYYYQEFYHIKSAQLDTVMENALNGVRCAAQTGDSRTDWTYNGGYAGGWDHDKVATAIGVLSPSTGEDTDTE